MILDYLVFIHMKTDYKNIQNSSWGNYPIFSFMCDKRNCPCSVLTGQGFLFLCYEN